MAQSVQLSERNVMVVGEVLEAEVEDEAFGGIVSVERAGPLNYIRGEAHATEMRI